MGQAPVPRVAPDELRARLERDEPLVVLDVDAAALRGGFDAWVAAGRPTEPETDETP